MAQQVNPSDVHNQNKSVEDGDSYAMSSSADPKNVQELTQHVNNSLQYTY